MLLQSVVQTTRRAAQLLVLVSGGSHDVFVLHEKHIPMYATTNVRSQASAEGDYVLGALCLGTHAVIMTKAPFISPEPPIPETPRPTINILDDVETPHINDPNSNIAKNERKMNC